MMKTERNTNSNSGLKKNLKANEYITYFELLVFVKDRKPEKLKKLLGKVFTVCMNSV